MPCILLPCCPRRLVSRAPCLTLPVSLVLPSLISSSLSLPCSVSHHVGVLQSSATVVTVLSSSLALLRHLGMSGYGEGACP